MTGNAELSGVDLARVALHAAQEAARSRRAEPSARKATYRARPVVRDGRDPVGLGKAMTGLFAERAWDTPAAGGSVLAQWPAIAGDLAHHVAAVSFDGETLDLQPDSSAYATHLKFEANRLIGMVNEAVQAGTVKSIRILRPGPASRTPQHPASDAGGAASRRPVRSEPRREPPQGYREAIAAARANRSMQNPDPERAHIGERQSRASRARRGGCHDKEVLAAPAVPAPQRETTEQTRSRALRRLELERQETRERSRSSSGR